MTLINEYKKWIGTGILPYTGLCFTLKGTIYFQTLEMFRPNLKEQEELYKENKSMLFWGNGENYNDVKSLDLDFTPLRQTIVLLICAMHDEL